MPTQIFSLRMDDDDECCFRKQTDGAFPLSLLRLPTHRPSILSNSRRHRIVMVCGSQRNGGLLFSKSRRLSRLLHFYYCSFFCHRFFHSLFFEYFRGKRLFTHNRVRSRDFLLLSLVLLIFSQFFLSFF